MRPPTYPKKWKPSEEKLLESYPSPSRIGRVVVVYPNTYEVGMASLGFQTVFHLFAAGGFETERAFFQASSTGALESFPHPDPAGNYAASSRLESLLPEPVSLESSTPLSEFDVIAFSISFEDDYLNATRMLLRTGLLSGGGQKKEDWPLILAGGVAPSINPEPLTVAMDAICIGEAEELIPEITEILASGLSKRQGKPEVVSRLSSVHGVYAPGFGQSHPIKRRFVPASRLSGAYSVFVTPESHFSETYLLEVARGCPQRCRFCAARCLYSPLRLVSETRLLDGISRAARSAKKLGLVGASVSDHPSLRQLVREAAAKGLRVSLSSLRLNKVDAGLCSLLVKSKTKSIAVAPEAGSERLRAAIGKPIAQESVVDAFEVMAASGLERIKAYFLLGLPWEEDDDLEAMSELIRLLLRVVSAKGSRLTVSIGIFVPKPWTPFQWCGMPERTELTRRIRVATKGLRKLLGNDLSVRSVRAALREALLCRGDRKVGHALVDVAAGRRSWNAVLRDRGIDEAGVVHSRRAFQERFPWDVVAGLPGKDRLWREFEESQRAAQELG